MNLQDCFEKPISGEWGTESDNPSETVPVLRTTNFADDGSITYEELAYRKIDVQKKKNKILRSGDIIIEKSGGTPTKPVGRTVFFEPADKRTYFCNNFTAILRMKTDKVLPKYAWYLLQQQYKMRRVEKFQNRTTGISNLDVAGYLHDIDFDVPDVQMQEKRIAIIDHIRDIVLDYKKYLAQLDTLVKAEFVELFGDLKNNPYHWDRGYFSDAIEGSLQNGLYKPQSAYTANSSTGTPILRIDAFYDGKVTDFSKLKRLSCTEEEKELYHLNEDDIVINRVNSIEYLGKCAHIVGLREETVFESNMMRFHVTEEYHPTFITAILCSKYMKTQIENHAKKSVNQASINQQDVQSFEIIKPPLALQNQFADFVAQVEKQKAAVQKSISTLATLRASLMQTYFRR